MNYFITIGKETLPVICRRHHASRRFVIRYQPSRHAVSLTLPRRASLKQALRFAEEKREWIARQIEKKPRQVKFIDGQVIPFLGHDLHLRHVGGRGVARREEDCLLVPGDVAFMARRVREWIKREAKKEMAARMHAHARSLGVRVRKVTLRDTGSCWGSCSARGNLSLSWRLAFAPIPVLDYVVAHEVAHIAEHNHSPAFWAHVARLCPHYRQAKAWLNRHGGQLHSFG